MWLFSLLFIFFFFKQKTAYEILDGDWSSDVCSSDLFWIGTPAMLPNILSGFLIFFLFSYSFFFFFF